MFHCYSKCSAVRAQCQQGTFWNCKDNGLKYCVSRYWLELHVLATVIKMHFDLFMLVKVCTDLMQRWVSSDSSAEEHNVKPGLECTSPQATTLCDIFTTYIMEENVLSTRISAEFAFAWSKCGNNIQNMWYWSFERTSFGNCPPPEIIIKLYSVSKMV